jgi:uncharacterized NAD(P)/FAD-binding protein YdhS
VDSAFLEDTAATHHRNHGTLLSIIRARLREEEAQKQRWKASHATRLPSKGLDGPETDGVARREEEADEKQEQEVPEG